MPPVLIRRFKSLEIEEKVIAGSALLGALSVFLPWFGGERLGEVEVWSGLDFYTSYVGWMILLMNLGCLALTLAPVVGRSLLSPARREIVRFVLGVECFVLLLVVLSVFLNFSLESTRMGSRFGVYLCLAASIVSSGYAALRMHQARSREVRDLFHHPDDHAVPPAPSSPEQALPLAEAVPPPPPPPPPPEEHPVLFTGDER